MPARLINGRKKYLLRLTKLSEDINKSNKIFKEKEVDYIKEAKLIGENWLRDGNKEADTVEIIYQWDAESLVWKYSGSINEEGKIEWWN